MGSAVVNTVHKEQVVAGSVSQNVVEIPTVQEVVQVQEIPEIQTVERVEEIVQKVQRPVEQTVEQTVEVLKIISNSGLSSKSLMFRSHRWSRKLLKLRRSFLRNVCNSVLWSRLSMCRCLRRSEQVVDVPVPQTV